MTWVPIHHRKDKVAVTRWLQLARKVGDLSAVAFAKAYSDLGLSEQRELLRLRFYHRRDEFMKFLFPETYSLPWNAYHRSVLDDPKVFWKDRIGYEKRTVTAAPRGIAKTTLTKGEMVHDILYGIEAYIVVISADVKSGSSPIVKHVCEFLTSDVTKSLYGEVKYWPSDMKVHIRVGGSRIIQGLYARSFKVQIRGTNVNGQRPTKVVVDDGEHPQRVKNPALRADDLRFLQDDVGKVGPKEGGLWIDWRGTILHSEAILPILATAKEFKAWKYKHWRSVISWPHREDLWEECHRVWANLEDEESIDHAKAFYMEHKEEMDAGSEVLDPVAEPIYKLYEQIWSGGRTSFFREKQNDIISENDQFFNMDRTQRFNMVGDPNRGLCVERDGELYPLRDMTKVAYLDPIPGKSSGKHYEMDSSFGGTDYAAIAVLAKDKFGYVYVLDCWMRRAKPSIQLEALWSLCERYGVQKAVIESNSFGVFFGRDFKKMRDKRKAEGKFWRLVCIADRATENKNDRIAALEVPMCSNGWLLLSASLPREVEQQFASFPTASHDDGPDAISGGYRWLGESRQSRQNSGGDMF